MTAALVHQPVADQSKAAEGGTRLVTVTGNQKENKQVSFPARPNWAVRQSCAHLLQQLCGLGVEGPPMKDCRSSCTPCDPLYCMGC